jgi:hypothetical protein
LTKSISYRADAAAAVARRSAKARPCNFETINEAEQGDIYFPDLDFSVSDSACWQ